VRPALALALVLLLLSVAFRLAPRAQAPLGPPLELVVAAKGPLLPAGVLGSGPERIGEALRIGDRTLVGDGGPGLRTCVVERSGALRGVARHDLGSAAGLEGLAAELERAREGDVLLLASSGSLEPREEVERLHARRDELLDELGARARPGRHTPESWALIALRGARGWIPLAEGTSRETGVVLAYSLDPARTLAPDFRADFVALSAVGGVRVTLEHELVHATRTGFAEATTGAVGGRPFPAIQQVAGPDGARLAWEGVTLGPGSGFMTWVGLADERSAGSDGVEFELRLDGEVVGRARVLPGAPWKLFQVDLRPHAGRRVRLELSLAPLGSSAGDVALWGRPMLVHGYERSPLEAWAEER